MMLCFPSLELNFLGLASWLLSFLPSYVIRIPNNQVISAPDSHVTPWTLSSFEGTKKQKNKYI